VGGFLLDTASTLALGPTQTAIKWVPEAIFVCIKRPGHETDHSPPTSAKFKNARSSTSTHPYVFMA